MVNKIHSLKQILKLTPFLFCLLIFNLTLSFAHAETSRVKRVIDGDTLLLENGEKVRLLGVNTPETKHPQKGVEYFGREAYLFTKKMVEGKKVRLEYDWRKRDRYGRLLAYVYLPDGTLLNAETIKQGYGFAYTKHPYRYLEDFRRYEREARVNGRGLWRRSPPDITEKPVVSLLAML